MLYYFYLTRNIIGLILVLSPLAGLLYIDLTFTLSMTLLCSLLLGTAAGFYLPGHVRFRLWTSAAGILACAGSFFCAGGAENPAAAHVGACMAGLAAGGLALNLPPCTVFGWFRASKTLLLAAVWTAALSLGQIYSRLMEGNTYVFLFVSLASVLAATTIFLEEPLYSYAEPVITNEPQTPHRSNGLLKVMFFAAVLGFAAFSAYHALPRNIAFDFFISPRQIFIAGLIAGPAAAGIISDSKSVYSGAVLMIFLAELAAAGSFNNGSSVFMTYAGGFSLGMLISGSLIIIPLLTFYLSDTAGFPGRIACASAAFLAGGILSLSAQAPAPFVFILLILSFMALFSAWKHRLFLLKRLEM